MYVIRDGTRETSTGCGPDRRQDAERQLSAYVTARYTPPARGRAGLADILIADVMHACLSEHADRTKSAAWLGFSAAPVVEWWASRTLADVRGKTCRDYVDWRTQQLVTQSARKRKDGSTPEPRLVTQATARHELTVLRAAINHWHREHGPLPSVPAVTLPSPAEPRDRWLTRVEAAALLRAARADPATHHLARAILIGLYTGTRSGALLRLSWLPSTTGGWVDLTTGVMYRRGSRETATRKLQTPVRMPAALMAHLRRWKRLDADREPTVQRDGMLRATNRIVHFQGRPVAKLRRSWRSACERAGLGREVTPHTLRHTAVTWMMQSGVELYEAAGFFGMSPAILEAVYGHQHPDFQMQAVNSSRARGQHGGTARSTKSGASRDPGTNEQGSNVSQFRPRNPRQ